MQQTAGIACTRCGTFDTTLRVYVFTFIVSVIVLSVKRPVVGVFCARCRTIRAIQCAALTAVTGWWGIPWGIAWSMEAIVRNARGGDLPAAANATLLDAMAAHLRANGQELAASDIAEEARRYAATAEIQAAKAARPVWQRPLVQILAGVLVLGFVGAIVMGVTAAPSAPAPSVPTAKATPPATMITTADFSMALPPGWYRVDVDPTALESSLADLKRRYGVDGAGLRERARAGAKVVAVYVGPEVVLASGAPVLMITMDRYTGAGGLTAVLNGVVRSISRDTRLTTPTQSRMEMPQGEVGVVRYEVASPNVGPAVVNYVFYRPQGDLYFLRFDVDADFSRVMADSFLDIVGTFHPAK